MVRWCLQFTEKITINSWEAEAPPPPPPPLGFPLVGVVKYILSIPFHVNHVQKEREEVPNNNEMVPPDKILMATMYSSSTSPLTPSTFSHEEIHPSCSF